MAQNSKHSILGGTFDHFHVGHESFIRSAFLSSDHVTIGIVESPFSNAKSYSNSIESYDLRIQNITAFLNKNGYSTRSTIIPIHDIYGTTLTDQSIKTIFVTSSTAQNADLINSKRATLGLSPLKIIVVPHVKADDGQIVSSSLIRAGLIDRSGHSYLKIFESNQTFILTDSLKSQLRLPMGPVIKDIKNITTIIPPSTPIITVGDVVSMDLNRAGFSPTICIVDFRTKRQDIDDEIIAKYFHTIHQTLSNPAGTINPMIAYMLMQSFENFQKSKNTQIIKINGEEDLLALPAILLSPLNSYVIYGLPDTGICLVKVTNESKTLAEKYLSTFRSIL
jgi:cytidyltransferase-like protein